MQIQPYSERIRAVVSESQISVQVLLSQDNDDLEFVRVKQGQPYISPEEWTARKLRAVGFVGLDGLRPRCAFSEALPSPLVERVAAAFARYVCILLGENLAERMAAEATAAEFAELYRLQALPDPRMN